MDLRVYHGHMIGLMDHAYVHILFSYTLCVNRLGNITAGGSAGDPSIEDFKT